MKITIILTLTILLFVSFSNNDSKKVITYAIYEYDSERLESKEDLIIFQYINVQPNGESELINHDGKSYKLKIDRTLVKKLNKIGKNGLHSQILDSKKPKGTKYAGHYSYLCVRNEKICYNPYDLKEELKTALAELDNQINNSVKNPRTNLSE